jgi:hypothetical protein
MHSAVVITQQLKAASEPLEQAAAGTCVPVQLLDRALSTHGVSRNAHGSA